MGERVLCKHEVVGSIPSGSTRRLGCADGVCPVVLELRERCRPFVMFEIVKREYT